MRASKKSGLLVEKQTNDISAKASNLIDAQQRLKTTQKEFEEKNLVLEQREFETRELVSQLRSLTYRILFLAIIPILVLGVFMGWSIPKPF